MKVGILLQNREKLSKLLLRHCNCLNLIALPVEGVQSFLHTTKAETSSFFFYMSRPSATKKLQKAFEKKLQEKSTLQVCGSSLYWTYLITSLSVGVFDQQQKNQV